MSNPTPQQKDPAPKFMRVSGGTDCHKLASCLVESCKQHYPQTNHLDLEFVGAGPCGQATKSVIIANNILVQHGICLTITPYFKSKNHDTLTNFVVLRFKLNIIPLG